MWVCWYSSYVYVCTCMCVLGSIAREDGRGGVVNSTTAAPPPRLGSCARDREGRRRLCALPSRSGVALRRNPLAPARCLGSIAAALWLAARPDETCPFQDAWLPHLTLMYESLCVNMLGH